ncbi:nuclear transport factor 2 family protein [Rhodovibrionaceae bacterium A322]
MQKESDTMTETLHQDIAAVVATYVNGMCRGDAEELRSALHPRMSCIGHFDGSLEWASTEEFIGEVLSAVKEPDPDPWFEINSINVIGDVATVQVENIWLGMHFDDSLTLLHHEDRWQVVAKVFFLRPKD